MKKLILSVFAAAFALPSIAQTDTIYSNSGKISCQVKEITPDAVKYVYPNEEVTNSVYKNTVQKIVFKNGRVQTFAEATSLKKVTNVNDYENVSITEVEGEVKGLFKLEEVSSKAKGTTTMSNQERVKERAYKKLKIQAAMMGANIVYLTNQRGEGNKVGSYYQSGSTAETSLSGVGYTNVLPNFDEFQKLIANRKDFAANTETKLWSSGSDMEQSQTERKFQIQSIVNENGLIYIIGKLEDESDYTKFRVVSFNSQSFNIFYKDKSTSYNYLIKI